MSDLEKKFIKRVRQEIATRKLTLTSVAERIGSSRQVLSQILNGKFNSMRAGTMLKLAMVLRISLDEIIFPETDLVIDSMTLAQALARDGVPEEEILQGIRNSTNEEKRARVQAAHYNNMAKHVRDLGFHIPYFPETIEPKTVTWGGADLEDLKKACEKVDTVNVKSGINGDWICMPKDKFFRMIGDKMMMEARNEQDQSDH